MSSKKDWTDQLPELLEGFSEAEPEGLWDAVRSGMEPQKKRRVVPVWWWYVGGAAAAAAAVIAVLLLRSSSPSAPEILAPVPGTPSVIADMDESSTEVVSEDVFVPQTVPARHKTEPVTEESVIEPIEQPVSDDNVQEEIVPEDVAPEETVPAVIIPQDTVSEEEPVPQKDEEDTPPPVIPHIGTEPVTPPVTPPATTPATTPAKPRHIIKPRVQVMFAFSPSSSRGVSTSVTGVGIPSSPGMATKATGAGADAFMLSRNKTTTTEATHRQASRVSFGLKVDLDEHWGVETGVVSSSLESQFNTTGGSIASETTRTMDYIGIPLYGCYNVFQWKKLGLSLNAGPMYEFSVGTNTNTESFAGNRRTDQSHDDTTVDDDKWSVNAGAALQYKLNKHGSLFVQPGVSYYFKDSAPVETIYTEQPAAFNLFFGYKYQF
jgi:hypothetical protein